MKALSKVDKEQINNDLQDINKYTVDTLSADDVYVFDVILCDSEIDRVGDRMSEDFLEELANRAGGLTGLIDHDWSAKNQQSRVYRAWTEKVDNITRVHARAYTLAKYTDYIDKISSGLLKEVSVSFESEGDTCSICGELMVDDGSGVCQCKNKHVPLHYYKIDNTDVMCYNNIHKLKDLMEWSLVAVPCQRGAAIKNKGLGGIIMKRSKFLLSKLIKSKSFEEGDVAELEKALDVDTDEDINEEDVKALLDENATLKSKVKELEDELTTCKADIEHSKICGAVDKAWDTAGLADPTLKSLLNKEINMEGLEFDEDGNLKGLEDQINQVKDKYKSLFVTESDTEKLGGHDEPDGDEAGVVDVDKLDTDGDAGKIMVTGKKKGLTFGVSDTTVKKKNVKKPNGLYFN